LRTIAHHARYRSKIGLIPDTRENQGDKKGRNHERKNEPVRSFVALRRPSSTALILPHGKSFRKLGALDFSGVDQNSDMGPMRKNCENCELNCTLRHFGTAIPRPVIRPQLKGVSRLSFLDLEVHAKVAISRKMARSTLLWGGFGII
jgi:hypothetical protein